MILSFAARLFCVAAVVTGVIHLVLESFLWLASGPVMRRLENISARHRERILYTLQLVPLCAGLFLTGLICVPRYMLAESNHDIERVGWFCISGALLVVTWYGCALLRGVRIAARTVLFARASRRASRQVTLFRAFTPIFCYPGDAYGVALVGFFRPFILISESLLGAGGLPSQAIDIVLAHEAAHDTQLDNWKLLSLSCVPSLGLRLLNGKTWAQLWRGAAEWAADDDAVCGDRTRVLVLAETLVAVARCGAQQPHRVCMALACGQAELVTRVDRLIAPPQDAVALTSWRGVCSAAFGIAGVVGAALGVLLSSHELVERLLHLGHG